MSEIKVGVVSTRSPTTFVPEIARRRIAQAFDEALAHFTHRGVDRLTIVLRSLEGVLAIAHEEAKKRGWDIETLPHNDPPIPSFHPSKLSILGRDWGESSSPFVAAIDGIIEIGGPEPTCPETLEAMDQKKPVFVYQLLMLSTPPEPAQAV